MRLMVIRLGGDWSCSIHGNVVLVVAVLVLLALALLLLLLDVDDSGGFGFSEGGDVESVRKTKDRLVLLFST